MQGTVNRRGRLGAVARKSPIIAAIETLPYWAFGAPFSRFPNKRLIGKWGDCKVRNWAASRKVSSGVRKVCNVNIQNCFGTIVERCDDESDRRLFGDFW